jgi:hypothetical protein
VTLIVSNAVSNPESALTARDMGLDFVAFYRAGVLVRENRSSELYDLEQTRAFDRDLAEREGIALGEKFGAFFNPPFFALLCEPFAFLGYRTALICWTVLSLACAAAAGWLLACMIPSKDFKQWALAPALLVTSLPFIQTLCHAQNSCLSLLIAAGAVSAWRAARPILAGAAGALLIYKPQLAALLLLVMIFCLGWRAAAGAAITCTALLLLNVFLLPGTLAEYLQRLGPNVASVISTHPYIWARHTTLRALWQLLLNRSQPGQTNLATIALWLACCGLLGGALMLALWQNRRQRSTDRIIAAVLTAAPLLMPYYLDYDLILLAIPAVLLAAEAVEREPARHVPARDRWLVRLWIALYLILLINPGLTGSTGINFAVLLLSGIAVLSITRIKPQPAVLVGEPMFFEPLSPLSIAPVFQAMAS